MPRTKKILLIVFSILVILATTLLIVSQTKDQNTIQDNSELSFVTEEGTEPPVEESIDLSIISCVNSKKNICEMVVADDPSSCYSDMPEHRKGECLIKYSLFHSIKSPDKLCDDLINNLALLCESGAESESSFCAASTESRKSMCESMFIEGKCDSSDNELNLFCEESKILKSAIVSSDITICDQIDSGTKELCRATISKDKTHCDSFSETCD